MTDAIPPGARLWTQADDDKLRSLALSGMNSVEIATELGRSVAAVHSRSKTLGISLRVRPETSGRIAEFSEHEAD